MNHKHSFYRPDRDVYRCQYCERWFFGVGPMIRLVTRDPSKYLYLVEHNPPMGGMTRSFRVMVGDR